MIKGILNTEEKFMRLATSMMAVAIVLSASAEDSSALYRIATQHELYPQEKIHVVTDRDLYCGGDTVWLRTFVVDAVTLGYAGLSKYVYIELRNPFEEVVSRIKLIDRDSVFAGYVPIAEDMPEGTYTLTAYTAFAENLGKDYFFRKPLKIVTPYASKYIIDSEFSQTGQGEVKGNFKIHSIRGDKMNYNTMSWTMPDGNKIEYPDSPRGFSRKFKRNNGENVVLIRFGDYAKFIPVEYPVETTDIRFYPEGGHLIAGVPCEIAFKATDENGLGVSASGIVRDASGSEITKFSTIHNGMGKMSFIPEADNTYTAEYIGPDGSIRDAEIGSPKPGAASLRYVYSRHRSIFSVAGGEGMDLQLILTCRGKGVLATALSPNKPISINKDELPTGLYQALLVSRPDSMVVSERIFFIGADRQLSRVAEVTADSSETVLKAPEGGKADCCVRIVDNKKANSSGNLNSLTQLLLQSELRGRIEDPAYYFNNPDRDAELNLDLLMMVNGWSRYNIPDAILGKYTEPTYPLEIGQEISGHVHSRWRNKPMEGIRVFAIVPKLDFGAFADTDANGEFHLDGFDFPEGTSFIFRAMNDKGGNEGNYEISDMLFPDSDILKNNDHTSESEISDFFKGSRWILLDEIEVQAFSNKEVNIYEMLASKSKTTEDFKKNGITTLEQALRDIAGTNIINGRLYWRKSPVKYYIDGVRFDPISDKNPFQVNPRPQEQHYTWFGFGDLPGKVMAESSASIVKEDAPPIADIDRVLPFNAIKRIDFIRSGEALILGNDLPGGALMITTKSGDEQDIRRQFDLKDYIPLGYQKYKEFASPLLSSEADAYDLQTIPTLLWLPSVRFDERGTDIKLKLPIPSGCDIIIEGISDDGPIYEIH